MGCVIGLFVDDVSGEMDVYTGRVHYDIEVAYAYKMCPGGLFDWIHLDSRYLCEETDDRYA